MGEQQAVLGEQQAVLDVQNLRVGFRSGRETTTVVDGVGFTLEPGRCLALVGESGSGKSVTARSILGLAGQNATVTADRLVVGTKNVLTLSVRQLRGLRGADVGLVLQDALVSLDPLRTVGREIADALRLHTRLSPGERSARVQQLLVDVGVPQPEFRARQRSGELSGGLRQRALIASAIALDPPLLIADEPTTALDTTVQEQILLLLERLKREGTAVLLISHDLAVVGRIADRIAVMTDGRIVEQGPADRVLGDPQHEYTKRLIRAVPAGRPRGTPLAPAAAPEVEPEVAPATAADAHAVRREGGAERGARLAGKDGGGGRTAGAPALEAHGLVKSYRNPDGSRRVVVDDVSLSLARGQTLGLVGESGSGKTTTARLVLGLTAPDAGTVALGGAPWSILSERERRPERRRIGAIYQDPLGSFDPRWTVREILTDALTDGRSTRDRGQLPALTELLDSVGLAGSLADRRPLHLSGGQRQRVAIARALAPQPDILVCDEPVSALDVSVQAQVLDLLDELQRERGLSYLFISHDLGVVQHMSDTVAVMLDGRIVESGPSATLFANPADPYTRRLLAASPRLA
ncbi:ABC transporter ATP-binding protein [Subtercola sp. Z020]|uniref:dipeptide ABC transporter ATP-binding protein n=1 Tax=Subtercola sp. Z020 TaxID=2080582 RepID=UPI000CE73E57|nr:ABC transporter ATP-binding protein [Subtercola sp. Z020]PPF80296.1 ABC transporter ATP-binding protein [Subtercola sp. Z020]